MKFENLLKGLKSLKVVEEDVIPGELRHHLDEVIYSFENMDKGCTLAMDEALEDVEIDLPKAQPSPRFHIDFSEAATKRIGETLILSRAYTKWEGNPDALGYVKKGDEVYASAMMHAYVESTGISTKFRNVDLAKEFLEDMINVEHDKYWSLKALLEDESPNYGEIQTIDRLIDKILEDTFESVEGVLKYYNYLSIEHEDGYFTEEQIRECGRLLEEYGW